MRIRVEGMVQYGVSLCVAPTQKLTKEGMWVREFGIKPQKDLHMSILHKPLYKYNAKLVFSLCTRGVLDKLLCVTHALIETSE
jgi:hypothetical protein